MAQEKTTFTSIRSTLPLFSQWLVMQGKTQKTIKNYVSDIQQLVIWLEMAHPEVDCKHLNEKIILSFLQFSLEEGYAEQTVARRKASLRKFEEFAQTALKLEVSFAPQLLQTQMISESAKSRVFNRFALALKAQDCKEVTIKNYLVDLELFVDSFPSAPITELFTKPKIAEYQAKMRQSGLSESTQNRKLSTLKRFCSWAQSEGIIIVDPFGHAVTKTLQSALVSHKPQVQAKKHPFALLSWYNQSRISSYLHLSVLVIFAVFVGLFAYQQFFTEVGQKFAYPSSPVQPGRRLSFQGRLTDTAGNAITTSINVQFRLYNTETGGSPLWSSGACSIDPDQDGVFSTLLGDSVDGCGSEISADVFSENSQVWLEVQVASETLTPRQKIATVPYALNSETVQGFPVSLTGQNNTIPVVNALGEIILGANNPSIIASSGAFLIQGESLTFQTEVGSQGDITFAPDAGGTVIVNSGTTSQDSLYISNANLTNGNLIHGYVGNNTSTGNLLTLSSGSVEQEKFSVSTRGDINVFRAATIGGSLNVDSNTLFVDEINNRVGVGTSTPQTKLDIIDLSGPQLRLTSVANSQYANFTVNNTGSLTIAPAGSTGNITLDSVSNLFFSDARATNIPLSVNDSTLDANLGQGIIDAINDVYAQTQVGSSLWNITAGALSPKNLTADLLIGGNSTASAKFAFLNVNTGTPTASFSGNLILAGNNRTIGTVNKATLGLGTSQTGDITLSPGGSTAVTVKDGTGNVGIGVTNPVQKFEVNGRIKTPDTGGLYLGTDNDVSLYHDGSNAVFYNTTGQLQLRNASAFDLNFFTNNISRMVVNGSSGNVGIGTAGPDAKLDVLNTSGAQLRLTYTDGSVYSTFTTDAGGDLTIVPTGLDTNITGNLDVSGTLAVGSGNAFQVDANGNITTSGDLALNGGDLTTSGDLTITPAGADLIVPNSRVTLGTSPGTGLLNVQGAAAHALVMLNETGSGNQDILTASASGTTVARLDRNGNLFIDGSIADLNQSVLTINDSVRIQGNAIQDAGGANAITFDGSQNTSVLGTLTLPNSSILVGDTGYLRSTRGLAFGANETYYIDASGHANLNNITAAGTLDINGMGVHDIAGTLNLSGGILQRSGGNLTVRTTSSGNLDLNSAGELTFNDTRTDSIPLSLSDTSLNAFPVGDRAIVDALNYLFINSGGGGGGSGSNYWFNNTDGVYPVDNTQSLLIGGSGSDSAKFRVNGITGDIYAHSSLNAPLATLSANFATSVPLTVVATSGQTGNLTSWKDSSGSVMAYISATGVANLPANGLVVGTNQLVAASGNIGIGTATPTQKLDIIGNLLVRDNESATKALRANTSGSDMRLSSAGDDFTLSAFSNADFTGTEYEYLSLSNGSQLAQAIGLWNFAPSIGGTAHHIINGSADGDVIFNSDQNNATDIIARGWNDPSLFFAQSSTNRVGIGTATPSAKLHVSEGVGGARILIGDTGTNSALGGIGFASSLTTGNYSLSGNGTSTYINAASGGNIDFSINNGNVVQITSTGDLRLGASAPSTAKLNFNASVLPSGGIAFGADTNLYRNNTNSLKTDDLFVSAGGIAIGTDTLSSNFELDVSGDVQLSGQMRLGNVDITSNPTGLGTGALLYGTNDNKIHYFDGVSWVSLAASTDAGGWYLNEVDKVVYQKNVTFDVLVGGTSTASAKFRVDATNGSFESAGNATISGTGIFGGQVKIGNAASDPTALGAGSLYYNTSDNKVYYFNGSQWAAFGDATDGSLWYLDDALGVLRPKNNNPDLVIGGYATASATFKVNATTGDILTDGDVTLEEGHRLYNVFNGSLPGGQQNNLYIDSAGGRVIIEPDLQIIGGDILGANGDVRLSLYDNEDKTELYGLLDIIGKEKIFDSTTSRGEIYTHLNALDRLWTLSREFNTPGTEFSAGMLNPANNDELKLASTADLTNKTWSSTEDFNASGTAFSAGMLDPATDDQLRLTTTFSAPSGLPGWLYRKPVTMTSPGVATLTDFQTSFIVDTAALISAGKMQADCGDIRVTDSTGTNVIPFYVEVGCNTTLTLVWIKAPTLTTGSNTFYLYYGNTFAQDISSGESVFELFDDFDNGISSSKWTLDNATGISASGGKLISTNTSGRIRSVATFGSGYAQEVYYQPTTAPTGGVMAAGFYTSASNAIGVLDIPTGNDTVRNDSVNTSMGGQRMSNGGNYYIRLRVIDASNVTVFVQNYWSSTSYANTNFSNAVSAEPVVLGTRYDNTNTNQTMNVAWEWVRVRKSVSPSDDPTGSVGSESAGAYTSGEQTWESEAVDAGSGNTFKPNRFTASWALDGSNNIAPKFQIIGSTDAAFTSPTYYPNGVSSYYQDGGTYDIDSGSELNVSAEVTTAYRFWKVKAFMETGANTADTPLIFDLRISGQGQYAGGEQTWESEVLDSGSDTSLFVPNRLTAKWTLDGTDNIAPKFRVLGSTTGAFAGEETIYPSASYFQNGTSNNIQNNQALDLASYITNPGYRYWKVQAVLDTGTDTTDTPRIHEVRLQEEKPLVLNPYGQKVGVNTASPDAQLHVVGDGTADLFKVSSSSADYFRVKAGGDIDIGSSSKNDINLTLYGDLFQANDTTLRSGVSNIQASYLYDTTRDSDGGSWRNSSIARTLSWYTETRDSGIGDACNVVSDDRCGERHFPAKANLVITNDSLYIFDVSTNEMWMKFSQGNGYALGSVNNNTPTSVIARDGIIYIGTSGTDSTTGIYEFDFKTDTLAYWDTTQRAESNKDIAGRNTTNSFTQNANSAFALTNKNIRGLDLNSFQGLKYLAASTDAGINLINLDYVTNYEFLEQSSDINAGTITTDGHTGSNTGNLAFDRDTATFTRSDVADNNFIVTYQFNSGKTLRRYGIVADDADLNEAPSNWTFEASNNGSSWTTLDTQTGISSWVDVGTESDTKYYEISNSDLYTYYRLSVTDVANASADQVRIAEIYLQEREAVPAVRVYGSNLTRPKYTVSSSHLSTTGANNLFDKRRDTIWRTGGGNRLGWIQYHSPTPIAANRYNITANNTANRLPTAWRFMGSNDGVDWTTLDTQSGQSLVSYIRTTYTFTNTTTYKYYRFKIDTCGSDVNHCEVSEFEVNGPTITANGSNNNTTNDESNIYFQDQPTTSYYYLSQSGQNGGSDTWLKYDYGDGNARTVRSYSVRGYVTAARAFEDWTLEGSNDDSSWTTLDTRTNAANAFTNASERLTYAFNNSTAYRYYRLTIDANDSDANFVDSRGFVLDDWEIQASSERDNVIGNYAEVNLTDDISNAVGWDSLSGDTTGEAILNFGALPQTIGAINLIGTQSLTFAPRDWTLYGSNDRSTWTSLASRKNAAMSTTTSTQGYLFGNDQAYRYYKFDIDRSNGSTTFSSLYELQLIGGKYDKVRFSGNALVAVNTTTGELDIFNNIWDDTNFAKGIPDVSLNSDPQNDTVNTNRPSLSANYSNESYALEAVEGKIYYGSEDGLDILENTFFENTSATPYSIRKTAKLGTNTIVANRYGLTNYWPFEESAEQTSVADYGLGGADSYAFFNTTNNNAPDSTSNGKIGRAYTFDRSNAEHIVIPAAEIEELDRGDGNYTVGAWIEPTTTTGVSRMIMGTTSSAACGAGTCHSGWWLGLAADNANRISWAGCPNTEGGGCNASFTTDAGDVTLGSWNHVVIRRNSSGTSLFVNGKKVYTTSTLVGVTDGSNLYIGTGGAFYTANTFGFDGTIDEPFITNRGLSDEQIRNMYREGAGELQVDAITADIFSQNTIGATTENWELSQFRGRVVEITDGTGVGQTRLISKNDANTLNISPAWSTVPDSSSVFRVTPYNLPDNTEHTKAFRVDAENYYLGLNDGANNGGVVRINKNDVSVVDYYHSDAGKTDDHGNVWNNSSGYDNIVGISTTQDNLIISAETQIWREKVGDSLLESIDKLQQAYSGMLINTSTQRSGGVNEPDAGAQVIRKGWGFVRGTDTSKKVYFGVSFTQTPIVIMSQAGVLDSADPSSLEECSLVAGTVSVIAATATNKDNFTVTENGSAASRYCFTWIAIGPVDNALPDGSYSSGADLAEWYGTDDTSLAAGEIVSVAASGDIKVERTQQAQDSKSIGIIATQPSITLGPKSGLTPGYNADPQLARGAKTAVQVALAGRVPLKVSLENGPIQPGDYLTSSSIPGVAAKAIKAGPTIGKALEPFDGSSTLVAIAKKDAPLEEEVAQLSAQSQSGVVDLNALSITEPESTESATPITQTNETQELLQKESFDELNSGLGTIMTFVNTSYFDPGYAGVQSNNNAGGSFAIDSSGKLTALGSYSFDLVDTVRQSVFAHDDFGGVASSSARANNNTASGSGSLDRQGVLDSALARLQTLGSLALKELNVARVRVLDELFAAKISTDQLSAGMTETDLLKPLSKADMVFQLGGNSTQSGQLIVLDKDGQQLAAIDGSGRFSSQAVVAEQMESRFITAEEFLSVTGNASISGELLADSARINNLNALNASVSGTLFAHKIEGDIDAQQITNLEQRVRDIVMREKAEVPASPSGTISTELVASLLQPETKTTDEFGTIAQEKDTNNLLTSLENDVALNGSLIAQNISVQDILTIGKATFTSNTFSFDVDSSNPFYIQPSGNGTLNLLASTMVISKDGGVSIQGDTQIDGDLTTRGSLFTSLIQPLQNSNVEVQLAAQTNEETPANPAELIIRGTENKEVAAFSASGSARFQKLIIASEEARSEEQSIETSIVTNSTTGIAKLPAGSERFTIRNTQLRGNSLVYLTPTSSTQNKVLYVVSKTEDNLETPENESAFVVGIDGAVDQDVTFNWWIIN